MQARRGPLARQVVACYRRQVEFASLKGARHLHGHALAGVRVVVGACGASMNAAWRRRPPLVPVGTTFPPQAGAQQSFAWHFFH